METLVPVTMLILVFCALIGVITGILLDNKVFVRNEKKEELKKYSEVLRKVWRDFLRENFYEPLVYEVAKEVSETGNTDGPNHRKWIHALNVLELLGFTNNREVKEWMSMIHQTKATKFMVDIKWSSGMNMPYMGKRNWSILYLDEKKDQIVHLYSSCRRDALAEFPLHQLVKAKEIQIHNPDGDLTDSLDVRENSDEFVLVSAEGVELHRYTKPQPVFSSDP